MKAFFLFSLVLFFATQCRAQEATCNLQLSQAPALFGLKLGMTPENVQTVFGRDLKIKIKKMGGRVFFQNFIKKPAPPSLAGVRALYLRFLDRKLYQIEIFYEDKPSWRTLEDFVVALSAELNLPAAFKEKVSSRNLLDCAEFTLSADKVLNPRVELTDKANLANFERLQQEEREKKKRG